MKSGDVKPSPGNQVEQSDGMVLPTLQNAVWPSVSIAALSFHTISTRLEPQAAPDTTGEVGCFYVYYLQRLSTRNRKNLRNLRFRKGYANTFPPVRIYFARIVQAFLQGGSQPIPTFELAGNLACKP